MENMHVVTFQLYDFAILFELLEAYGTVPRLAEHELGVREVVHQSHHQAVAESGLD